MSKEVLQEVLSFCQPDVITKSSSSNKWIFDVIYCPNSSPRFLWRWHHPVLSDACIHDDVSIVHLMIAAGANVNGRQYSVGLVPLHHASSEGCTEVVRALIAAGANVKERNYNGWTPLHYASYYGHLPIVCHLIAVGANVNERNNYGRTPLQYASYYGHLPIVRHLIAVGANVNERNNYGETPLCWRLI